MINAPYAGAGALDVAEVAKDRIDTSSAALEKMLQISGWKKFCAETHTCIAAVRQVESRKLVHNTSDATVSYIKDSRSRPRTRANRAN